MAMTGGNTIGIFKFAHLRVYPPVHVSMCSHTLIGRRAFGVAFPLWICPRARHNVRTLTLLTNRGWRWPQQGYIPFYPKIKHTEIFS